MKTVKELEAKYTRIVKMDGRWNTHLQIDQQGFIVCFDTTKARAKWYAKMLAMALERLIKGETEKE